MNYQLIESNLMTTDLIKDFEKELLRIKAEMEYQNTEIRLLRDWRDTWLTERELLYKRNDELRSVMAKIADMTRKTVYDQLLNKD